MLKMPATMQTAVTTPVPAGIGANIPTTEGLPVTPAQSGQHNPRGLLDMLPSVPKGPLRAMIQGAMSLPKRLANLRGTQEPLLPIAEPKITAGAAEVTVPENALIQPLGIETEFITPNDEKKFGAVHIQTQELTLGGEGQKETTGQSSMLNSVQNTETSTATSVARLVLDSPASAKMLVSSIASGTLLAITGGVLAHDRPVVGLSLIAGGLSFVGGGAMHARDFAITEKAEKAKIMLGERAVLACVGDMSRSGELTDPNAKKLRNLELLPALGSAVAKSGGLELSEAKQQALVKALVRATLNAPAEDGPVKPATLRALAKKWVKSSGDDLEAQAGLLEAASDDEKPDLSKSEES